MGGRLSPPRPSTQVPLDLGVVTVLTALVATIAFLPGTRETAAGLALGLIYVFFLPGYALVAALFPGAGAFSGYASDSERVGSGGARSIDWFERTSLSFATSVAIVPLVVLTLSFTPWGIGSGSVVAAIAAFTLACTAIATVRRRLLSPAKRFQLPADRLYGRIRAVWNARRVRIETVVVIFIAASVLLAVATMAYAIAVPPAGEGSTQFYVGTETEDGEVIAADYPREFVVDEPQSLVVGVANDHDEPRTYTVVVMLEVVEFDDGGADVTERMHLFTVETDEIDPGENWERDHEIAPPTSGQDLRLAYFLYEEDPPDEPDPDEADQMLHLGITVTE